MEFLCYGEKWHLPAVQMVKTTCTESKKKNMTSRDTEAPIGRNRACVESIVWIPAKQYKQPCEKDFKTQKLMSDSLQIQENILTEYFTNSYNTDCYLCCCYWKPPLSWGYHLYPSPGSHNPCLMTCRMEGKTEREEQRAGECVGLGHQ